MTTTTTTARPGHPGGGRTPGCETRSNETPRERTQRYASSSGSEDTDRADGGDASASSHLASLDFGPGCDACAVRGRAGDRSVVATRRIKRGDIVVFEAPAASVKAGEANPSGALKRAFKPRNADGSRRAAAVSSDGVSNPAIDVSSLIPHEWTLTRALLVDPAARGAHYADRAPREWAAEYARIRPGRRDADANPERERYELHVASELAEEIGGDVTVDDVVAVHAVVCANAFALEAMCTRLNYGAGFFAAAAYMNHSCDPNCLSLRLGGNMAVFAARDVHPGEELTHSYLPSHQLLLPRRARRSHLFFDCRCVRCLKRAQVSRRKNDPIGWIPECAGTKERPGLELGGESPVSRTALANAAFDLKTAAVGGTPWDVLQVFKEDILDAAPRDGGGWYVNIETLQDLSPQASLELLEPVIDAHWRAALDCGNVLEKRQRIPLPCDVGRRTRCRPPSSDELPPDAQPPDAQLAASAARVWRDSIAALRARAEVEGGGVLAALEQALAAAEVSLYAMEAAEGGNGGNETAARKALQYLVAAHGDSLACAQEDTLCLRAMPAQSAAAAAFERILASVAQSQGGERGLTAPSPHPAPLSALTASPASPVVVVPEPRALGHLSTSESEDDGGENRMELDPRTLRTMANTFCEAGIAPTPPPFGVRADEDDECAGLGEIDGGMEEIDEDDDDAAPPETENDEPQWPGKVLEGVGAGWEKPPPGTPLRAKHPTRPPPRRSPRNQKPISSGDTHASESTRVQQVEPSASNGSNGAVMESEDAVAAWNLVAKNANTPPKKVGGGGGALLALLGSPESDPRIRAFVTSLLEPSSPSSSPESSAVGTRKAKKAARIARALPAPEVKAFPPSSKYVSYKPLGISLCFEKGILDCVHAYAEGVDGFNAFVGELPHELKLGAPPGSTTTPGPDRARSVVSRLGEPSQKGGQGRQVWMTYADLGVKVDVAAVDWEDGDAPIKGVSIWKP
jgi:hypothetical protein